MKGELPVETLKLGESGPTIGIDLRSYYDVLGDAFWAFIEERLIRICEKLANLQSPLTIWASLEPTGEIVIYFVGGSEESSRQAVLENVADLGFEDSDISIVEVEPNAEPLFGARNGKVLAFVDEIDPIAHDEGPKSVVFQDGEFLWAGYQLMGNPTFIEYSLYRIVGDENTAYHIEEERKVPVYFCRYLIQE